MRERDLYPAVKRWLNEHGYVVHVEIFDCDIVAVKDGKLTAVELKLECGYSLLRQLIQRTQWADEVIGVVPAQKWPDGNSPAQRQWASSYRQAGFGLLTVDGERAKLRLKPKSQPFGWHKKHAYRAKILLAREPAQAHESAGLPSCPELREQRLARYG